MQKKFRTLVFIFFFIAFIPTIIFGFIIWYIDPFALWHKPFYCPNQVYEYKNMRYNAKRFLERSDYDSLIFGSSMLENTSAKEAAKKLGGSFINISIRGSHFNERRFILDYALAKNKNIKQVLTTFDIEIIPFLHTFSYLAMKHWGVLYDKEILNDYSVYTNKETLAYIFSTFFKLISGKEVSCENRDFDRPASFFAQSEHLLGGIKNFAKNDYNLNETKSAVEKIKNKQISKDELNPKDLALIKELFDKDVIEPIKNHQDTEFIMIVAAYSVVKSAIAFQTNPAGARLQKYFLKYLLDQNLPNLKVYGFDDMGFTDDIANYVDLGHYSKDINSKMLDWIAQKKGILTTQNFDEYWDKYEQKSKAFDLSKFLEELQKAKE
ncbi:hypothetical protein [Campylobacter sp.]|uniref:hypothetical protein n=1 Tax=Campylobacter sp. TaxID=205 RepID=UPI002AA84BD7|nr:hypothetical protein [Campylobacter sp.]MCI7447540.1 hypothetical protein [Campylobacter sp.]